MRGPLIRFWALLLIFIGVLLWWTFYVPYQPERMARMIPLHAEYASHHEALAGRWDDFVSNPLARSLFTSMGLDPVDLKTMMDDPAVRPWMEKLLARDLVVAYVPASGQVRDPVWVMSGWIGSESIKLRWLLSRDKISGLRKIRRQAGGVYWVVDAPIKTRENLSIALVEGVLVACFSRDPHAVRHVLDVYEGIEPRHPEWESLLKVGATLNTPDAPDQGWFFLPNEPDAVLFSLDQADAHNFAGTLCWPESLTLPGMQPVNAETPSRFMGGEPFAAVGASPEAVLTLSGLYLPEPAPSVIRQIGRMAPVDTVAGFLLGGEYSGSLMGIAIPSLMVAWPVDDETNSLALAAAVLDRLNSLYRWGLVVTESRVGERIAHVVESTDDTPYARLRTRENMAYTVIDGWFILSSHAGPLFKLMSRYDRPESLFEADLGGWQKNLRSSESGGFAWIDMGAGAKTIRLALSAYSIKLLFEDASNTRELRQRLNEIRAWVDTLAPLGQAQVQMEQTREGIVLHIQVGEKP